MAMVMGGGQWRGTRVLGEASVREMLRSQVPQIVYGQGLIWYRVRRRGRVLVGHNGGDSGVATVAFFDPVADTGVVALANGNWHWTDGHWPLMQIMDRLFAEAPFLRDDAMAQAASA